MFILFLLEKMYIKHPIPNNHGLPVILSRKNDLPLKKKRKRLAQNAMQTITQVLFLPTTIIFQHAAEVCLWTSPFINTEY